MAVGIWGARWVKEIKDDQICFNKQQIKMQLLILFLIVNLPLVRRSVDLTGRSSYNHGHNILRLFDTLYIYIFFHTSKILRDYW